MDETGVLELTTQLEVNWATGTYTCAVPPEQFPPRPTKRVGCAEGKEYPWCQSEGCKGWERYLPIRSGRPWKQLHTSDFITRLVIRSLLVFYRRWESSNIVQHLSERERAGAQVVGECLSPGVDGGGWTWANAAVVCMSTLGSSWPFLT